MEIKINVDEAKFKDVLEKELDAFSKEELHEIVREMIVESFKTDNVLQSFFTKKVHANSWSDQVTTEAGDILKEAARCFDLSDCFKEIQQAMIDDLKNNHKELLENVMLHMIMDGLTNNYDFAHRMSGEIERIIMTRHTN